MYMLPSMPQSTGEQETDELYNVREKLKNTIRTWIVKPGKKPKISLVEASLGLGKTTALLKSIEHIPEDGQLIIAAPTKALAMELQVKSGRDGHSVFGRSKDNCLRHEMLGEIYLLELRAKGVVCPNCEAESKCSFYKDIKTSKTAPLVFTTHHMAYYLAGASDLDSIIVFDESPSAVIRKRHKADLSQMQRLYDFLEIKEKHRRIINTMRDIQREHTARITIYCNKQGHDEDHIGYVRLRDLPKNKGGFTATSNYWNMVREAAIAKDLVFKARSGAFVLNSKMAKKHSIHYAAVVALDLDLSLDISYSVYGSGDNKPVFVHRVRDITPPCPVLILDGTPIPHDVRYEILYKATIEDDWKKSVFIKTQRGKGSIKKNPEAVLQLARDARRHTEGKVLCITKKDAVEVVSAKFQSWDIAYYGNIRGTNNYKHCSTVVLLLNHEPAPHESVMMYVMNNQMTFDPVKYAAWYDAYIVAEYKQAVARIRPLNSPCLKVVICVLKEWPLNEKFMVEISSKHRGKLVVRALAKMAESNIESFSKSDLGILFGKQLDSRQWKLIREVAVEEGMKEVRRRKNGVGRPAILLSKLS